VDFNNLSYEVFVHCNNNNFNKTSSSNSIEENKENNNNILENINNKISITSEFMKEESKDNICTKFLNNNITKNEVFINKYFNNIQNLIIDDYFTNKFTSNRNTLENALENTNNINNNINKSRSSTLFINFERDIMMQRKLSYHRIDTTIPARLSEIGRVLILENTLEKKSPWFHYNTRLVKLFSNKIIEYWDPKKKILRVLFIFIIIFINRA
jgi:hypothetical protein